MSYRQTMTTYKGYALRFDVISELSEAELVQIISDLVKMYSVSYLVSREIATITKKVHFHIYMECDSKVRIETINKQVNRKLPFHHVNKGLKSVVLCRKKEKYLGYICKDKDIRLNRGFSEQQIAGYVSAWVPTELYVKRTKCRTVLSRIFDYLEDKKYDIKNITMEDAETIIYSYYMEKYKRINFYEMKDMVYSLYCHGNYEVGKDMFHEYINK